MAKSKSVYDELYELLESTGKEADIVKLVRGMSRDELKEMGESPNEMMDVLSYIIQTSRDHVLFQEVLCITGPIMAVRVIPSILWTDAMRAHKNGTILVLIDYALQFPEDNMEGIKEIFRGGMLDAHPPATDWIYKYLWLRADVIEEGGMGRWLDGLIRETRPGSHAMKPLLRVKDFVSCV